MIQFPAPAVHPDRLLGSLFKGSVSRCVWLSITCLPQIHISAEAFCKTVCSQCSWSVPLEFRYFPVWWKEGRIKQCERPNSNKINSQVRLKWTWLYNLIVYICNFAAIFAITWICYGAKSTYLIHREVEMSQSWRHHPHWALATCWSRVCVRVTLMKPQQQKYPFF